MERMLEEASNLKAMMMGAETKPPKRVHLVTVCYPKRETFELWLLEECVPPV